MPFHFLFSFKMFSLFNIGRKPNTQTKTLIVDPLKDLFDLINFKYILLYQLIDFNYNITPELTTPSKPRTRILSAISVCRCVLSCSILLLLLQTTTLLNFVFIVSELCVYLFCLIHRSSERIYCLVSLVSNFIKSCGSVYSHFLLVFFHIFL